MIDQPLTIAEESELRYRVLVEYGRQLQTLAECAGKHKFETRNMAHKGMHGESIRKYSEAYRCHQCGQWHVGNRRKVTVRT